MESTACTLLRLDGLMIVCCLVSMVLPICNDEAKCYCLFVAVAHKQVMMVYFASVLWTNTMLARVKTKRTYDVCMELRNTYISSVFRVFPPDLISKAAEKSNRVLHN